MNSDIASARGFVDTAVLPAPVRLEGNELESLEPPLDEELRQAAVVGSEIVSFDAGVSPERRADVLNATLFAQLVANKQRSEPKNLDEIRAWYDVYFDALSRLGFVVQDRGFSKFEERSDDFEAHEAILAVAKTFLAGAPGAIALLEATLAGLREVSGDTRWITLFNRESQSANTARFHVALVSHEDGQETVRLIAFGLEARSNLTQVLFFKFRTNEVELLEHSGRVTIAPKVLDGIRDAVAARLIDYAHDYIQRLPDL